jgi:hypothetical protein
MRLSVLADLFEDLESAPHAVWYVPKDEPVNLGTRVVLWSDVRSRPATNLGLRYLLETDTARDVVRVWSEWRGGRTPTLDEKLAAVLHYATYDSWLED